MDILAIDEAAADAASRYGSRIDASARDRERLAAQAPFTPLRRFHEALALRNDAPVDIVCLGDSITEGVRSTKLGQRWPWALRDHLRRACPVTGVTGGLGYIPAMFATSYLTDVPITLTGSPATNTGFGLGYRARTLPAGTAVTLNAPACTTVEIFYSRGTGSGTIGWSVDGGAVTNVVTTNGSGDLGAQKIVIPNLGGTAHTIKFEHISGGVGVLEGFMHYNGDETKGIRMWEGGHSGWTSLSFMSGNLQANWPTVNIANPALVVVALGTNDYWSGTAQRTSADYKTSMQGIIGRVRTYSNPDASIALVAPWRRADVVAATAGEPISNYLDKLWELQAENADVAVFDSGPRVVGSSGGDAIETAFIHSDKIHPKNAGMVHYGEALGRWLLPA